MKEWRYDVPQRGSKGGKHLDDVTDINVGSTVAQNQERGAP